MSDIPIWLPVSDTHSWLLPGFMHQLNKYWPNGRMVHLFVHEFPKIEMGLSNTYVHARGVNYPKDQWSNCLLEMLQRCDEWNYEYILLMLEDYWLTKKVDKKAINSLFSFISADDDAILRIDLSADRASRRHREIATIGDDLTVIESRKNTDYLMSLQAGIWNVKHLRSMLRPNESPWDIEIAGSARVADSPLRVLGTKNQPLKYHPMFRSQQGVFHKLDKFPKKDKKDLEKRGYL